jgi:Phytanoyl-CoA dioxygenase (PhyH)
MLRQLTSYLLKPHSAGWVKDTGLQAHGRGKLTRWAKRYNGWYQAKARVLHDSAYRNHRDELLRENGGDPAILPSVALKNGWAIDTSQNLPQLEELLNSANEIISERGERKHSDIQQPFLRSLLFPGDIEKYPALLDFITTSEVLSVAMDYMKTVPVLSRTRPPGIRFMESNRKLDPGSEGPLRASQFYHLDIHDSPLMYVLVAVQDITLSSGPWTFLPESVSEHAAKTLRYEEKGAPYRVTDERMYRTIDEKEAIPFAYPKGSVLFIDSSRCFHYGSRNSSPPRYQIMYGLTSVCRSDFSERHMEPFQYPVKDADAPLRRMVCQPLGICR